MQTTWRNIGSLASVSFLVNSRPDDFLTMSLDEMEVAFIEDFVQFGARISLTAALASYSTASTSSVARKRLSAAILQQLFTALEDFAVLLAAMIKRKGGSHLHLLMSFPDNQGTTQYPNILKKVSVSATELLTELGFTTVTIEKLRSIGYEIEESDLESAFSDFGESIKQLGEYVDAFNHPKNRLKHGKAVFGIAFGLAETDDIANLEYDKRRQSLGLSKTDASPEQVKIAIIFIAKLAKMTLELVALLVAHYHSEQAAERVAYLVKDEFEEVVASVKAVGITSKGLTE